MFNPRPSKRSIFVAFNAMHPMVTAHKLDKDRYHRGLGVVMAGDGIERLQKYHTSDLDCRCDDCYYRNVTCKHQIAYAILRVATELDQLYMTPR